MKKGKSRVNRYVVEGSYRVNRVNRYSSKDFWLALLLFVVLIVAMGADSIVEWLIRML